jgi:hypothetical protein
MPRELMWLVVGLLSLCLAGVIFAMIWLIRQSRQAPPPPVWYYPSPSHFPEYPHAQSYPQAVAVDRRL